MIACLPDELDVARLNAQGRHGAIVDMNRSRYSRLREAGLCTRGACHGPAVDGGSLCSPCRVDRRHEQRERYRRTRTVTRTTGCTRCGGGDGHNAVTCTDDPLPGWAGPATARRERDRAERKLRRERGQCITNPAHAAPLPGHARCEACNAKRRKVKT